MHLLRAATLVTRDPDATARLYATWFDYRVVEHGVVADTLAQSWGAPNAAGRRYAVCRPASGAEIYLRFVEGDAPTSYRALRTYGWAAIEICVQDVLAVEARMQASPFRIIGPPKPLDGLPTIFPMQVQGPDDEVVFLTQILGDLPEYELPRAQSLVDHLFILVLACSDLDASSRWLEHALHLQAGRALELSYGVLSAAFELPADHKHRIATLTHGRNVFLEVDQYPQNATARPRVSGELPPGVAIATFRHPDFDALEGPWITPPAPRDGAVYGGGRVGVMIGPDGALVEVVEALRDGGRTRV